MKFKKLATGVLLCAILIAGLQSQMLFAANDPTNRATYAPWTNGGTIEDVSSTLIGPVINGKTWKFTKTGPNNQWNGWEGNYNGIFNAAAGEYWTVSGYYKTCSPAGITSLTVGNFYKPDWSAPFNSTVVDSYTAIIPDGNWHFFYCTIRLNEPMTNGIIADGPSWNYSTQAGVLYINGLQWTKTNYVVPNPSVPNLYTSTSPWTNGGANYDVTGSSPGPVPNSKTWQLVKTGPNNQWNGWEGDYSGIFDAAVGETWTITGYYKTSSAAGMTDLNMGSIYKPDWSGPFNTTVLDSKTKIIADGKWHHFFCTIRANEPIANGIIADGPSWNYSTQAGVLYINGLQWIRSSYNTMPGAGNTTPDIVDWTMYQTIPKNQFDRRTCFAFAIIAGLEARYKRDYKLELDLSEQYFQHLQKSTWLDTSGTNYAPPGNFENQASIWGGGGGGLVYIVERYAMCLEADINYSSTIGVNRGYLTDGEMNSLLAYINRQTGNSAGNLSTQAQIDAFEYSPYYIPYAARQNATQYGATETLNAGTANDPKELEKVIAAGYDVIMDYNVPGDGHVVLVVGYNRSCQYFTVKDSASVSIHTLPYSTIRADATSIHYIKSVRNPSVLNNKGKFIGSFNMDHDGWKGTLIIRRSTDLNNNPTRLGHYIDSTGKYRVVNGYTIDDGRGLQFAIDDSAQYNEPGKMTGQVFYTDIFSSDSIHAGGYTTWNNIPFGVFLSRTENLGVPGGFTGLEEWAGYWSMNHDGWTGDLCLYTPTSLGYNNYAVSGYYRASDGNYYNVDGTISGATAHVANITIRYATPQNFTLLYHTWEDKLFSGYTYWDGKKFGLYGTKY